MRLTKSYYFVRKSSPPFLNQFGVRPINNCFFFFIKNRQTIIKNPIATLWTDKYSVNCGPAYFGLKMPELIKNMKNTFLDYCRRLLRKLCVPAYYWNFRQKSHWRVNFSVDRATLYFHRRAEIDRNSYFSASPPKITKRSFMIPHMNAIICWFFGKKLGMLYIGLNPNCVIQNRAVFVLDFKESYTIRTP